jgi:serine/threonine-protein kinase RsbT
VARESLSEGRGALLQFCDLKTEDDLVHARAAIKLHSVDLGFSKINQTKIVTAASELGRNVLEHGRGGSLLIEKVDEDGKNGLKLVFEDKGPGISDMALAMTDGYTSKDGLGLGLTGSKRLMDDFSIRSQPGQGTTVMVIKWM